MYKLFLLFLPLFLMASPKTDIYEKNRFGADILASVDSDYINLDHCREKRAGATWCRAVYQKGSERIKGWIVKERYIEALRSDDANYFQRFFGGRYNDIAKKVLVLDDGYLIGGYSESFGKGGYDAYVVKTDYSGKKIFSRVYGGGEDDFLEDIIAIGDRYIFAGKTNSFGEYADALYIGAIDKEGDLLWQRGLFLDEDDRYGAKALAKINERFVMAAGYEDRVRYFNSYVDMFVSAVGIDGKHTWARRYGGKEREHAESIVKLERGYLLAGYSDTWGGGNDDFYIVRLDANGKREWHKVYGGSQDERAFEAIATDDGGFLIVGYSDSFRSAMRDVYVVKTDENGTKKWHGHYGGEYYEEAYGVVAVDDGYVIVGFTNSTPNSDRDLYLLKIDKRGFLLWQRRYGGIRDDVGYDIQRSEEGGFVVVGYSERGVDSGADVFLLKLDKNGRKL